MAGSAKKKVPIEEELAQVAALASVALGPPEMERLRAALANPRALVVERAARLVRDRLLGGFGGDLEKAFARFLDNPVKTDPGCIAKLAALEALDATDHPDHEPFLTASRHKQLEPAWGPPVDTACGLRARAVRGLARLGFPDLLVVAGELLADAEAPVRQAAAEAVAHAGERSGAGLLLLALGRQDEDPVVRTAYLAGLMALAPDRAFPRLREDLFGPNSNAREEAAIALGESGEADAAILLRGYMESTPLASERAIAIRGLGIHRSDAALEMLLAVIEDGSAGDAIEAIEALSVRCRDPHVQAEVRAAAQANGSPGVLAALAETFPNS